MKRERCNDCAFTAGTEPNLYPPSKLRADLCLMNGEPFYCHKGDKPVCQGWIDERQKQGPVPDWKQELARQLSDLFEAETAGCWTDVEVKR